MNQFILLQEGDKITFGHTNGFKLEPGQRANQPNSEFEFVVSILPYCTCCLIGYFSLLRILVCLFDGV
jgi:hypothetical protein